MVDVEVEDGDALQPMHRLCVRHAHHHVVVQAEAAGRVRLGVMPGGAHHGEGAARPEREPRRWPSEQIVHSGHHEPGGTPSRD